MSSVRLVYTLGRDTLKSEDNDNDIEAIYFVNIFQRSDDGWPTGTSIWTVIRLVYEAIWIKLQYVPLYDAVLR